MAIENSESIDKRNVRMKIKEKFPQAKSTQVYDTALPFVGGIIERNTSNGGRSPADH